MTVSNFPSHPSDPAEAAAADWFARRDRGLTRSEQAAYAAWLGESPLHGETIARLEQVWRTLNPVFEEAVARGGPADPDLLAPATRRLAPLWLPLLVAAAAGAVFFFRPHAVPTPSPSAALAIATPVIHAAPERLVLADGSTVDLKDSAQVDVKFTPAERRIALIRGEAFFTVAKNPARPFIVTAGHITVRAVGTAFSVGLGPTDVSVLVTEGRVGVNELSAAGDGSPAASEATPLAAGQKGVISFKASPGDIAAFQVKTTQLTPDQMERALLWQGVRLEFYDLPLSAIAAAFNRYNRTQLVIGDAQTAALRMGGMFRADHVASFVRLLGTGFGVSATPQGDTIVLRHSNGH